MSTRFAALIALALMAVTAACGGDSERSDDAEGVTVEQMQAPAPAAGPMLHELTAAETGIDHKSTLRLERQVEFLTMGAGVAAGDYDGDGLVDIYLVSEDGPNHLYRNLGNWKFEDVTAKAYADVAKNVAVDRWTERFNTGAHFADVDGDKDLDLLVTALAGSTTLLENNGDGTFTDGTEASGLVHVGASTSASFGDYDRDGDLDAYLATHRPYQFSRYFPRGSAPVAEPELQYDLGDDGLLIAEADVLFRNRGDGTFEDVTDAAGLTRRDYGLGVKFTDLDRDGWPDLYVANDFETPDRLFINMRNGTFEEQPPIALRLSPRFSMGMDSGDINRDGWMDVITSDMLSPDRERRQTQSADAMESLQFHGATSGTGPRQVMRNVLHLNNGNGTFSDIAAHAGVAASDWTWTMKFADFDLDGWEDVIVTNGFVYDELNMDDYLMMANLKQLNKTDDIKKFQLSRPALATPRLLFRNRGDLTFESVGPQWGFDKAGISNGASLADLDNDGDLDVVVNNMNDVAGVYRNDASANRIKVRLEGAGANTQGLGARLTLDTPSGQQYREMSTSGGFLSSHEAVAVFGLGDAASAGPLTVEWPTGQVTVVAEIPANASVVVREPAGPTPNASPTPQPTALFSEVADAVGASYVHDEQPYDDFAAQPLVPERMSEFGPGVAWGDADGDGDPDLAIAGARGQTPGVFMNEDGRFQADAGARQATAPAEQQAMMWWPGGSLLASLSSVEEGSADTYAALQTVVGDLAVDQVRLPASAGPLAAADYDSDGQLDLFVGGRVVPSRWPEAASSGLFRGSPEGFTNVTGAAAPALEGIGMVTGAAWSDVDGDGDPDLLLTRDMGSPALLRNDGGSLVDATAEAGLAGLTGRWTGVATGDIDHDGDTDAVAVNLGTNTRYTASPDEPLVVYAGDLAGDGGLDVIETEWEGGRLYPLRAAMELGREKTYVAERFTSFLDFARAPIATVFGSDLEARAKRYEVAGLAHKALINDGAGHFSNVDLPLQAQLMASYGVVLEDLDADGNLDAYIVGNFDGPTDVRVGPFMGGVSVWLRGDGKGGFAPVPVSQSGLLVPEDGKGLAAADFDQDGDVDLAVGLNAGPMRLFRNGSAGRQSLTVRLRGEVGNPAGVGARVTVTTADGVRQTREVQSGGSFLSQSNADLLFGLGDAQTADIEVAWPDGTRQQISGAAAGQLHEVVRGSE